MIARLHRARCLLLGAALASLAGSAQAQDDDLTPASHSYVSPERFIIELRGGPYRPDMGSDPSFRTFFSDDSGPLLGLELDAIALRIDDALYVTGGGSIGLTRYSGNAIGPSGRVSEDTTFSILPLTALATLRIDALPRMLGVPFIFAGKVGWQWARWSTSTGTRDDASGWSLGLFYAGQLALDLDTFEPAAARVMDEEWSINHSYVLFEVYHFAPTRRSLPIGDTQWLLGLGFVF